MHQLIFFIFTFVCFILITLIILNPVNYNDLYNFSKYNNKFSILNFIYRDSILNTVTKIFILLFFLCSLMMHVFYV